MGAGARARASFGSTCPAPLYRKPMKLSLGFSPCPNDTFIFDALVHGAVDPGVLRFDPRIEDVQTLNDWAREARLDVTKVSCGVLPRIAREYVVLGAGGALGRGVGPLLVARPATPPFRADAMSVAIPGRDTTAHLLFSLAFPEAAHKRFMVFSDIERAVLAGEVDAGVIIHEGRFTYEAKGLAKLLDLGEHWEARTGSPIPLGAIVARRRFDRALRGELDRLVRESVLHANRDRATVSAYVRSHAQEMDEAVMRRHIELYVNDFSVDLGDAGRRAVRTLLDVHARVYPDLPRVGDDVFG
jgi:1,4-dihydroxy-6-naphthoate synthase